MYSKGKVLVELRLNNQLGKIKSDECSSLQKNAYEEGQFITSQIKK
jgi:hypothetical protein